MADVLMPVDEVLRFLVGAGLFLLLLGILATWGRS